MKKLISIFAALLCAFTASATYIGEIATNSIVGTSTNSSELTGITLGTGLTRSGDTLSVTNFSLILSETLQATNTSAVESTNSLSLPAGTYQFTTVVLAHTASSTAGITAQTSPSVNCSDATIFWMQQGTNATEFSSGSFQVSPFAATSVIRLGASQAQFLAYATTSPGGKTASAFGSGTVTFSSATVLKFKIAQNGSADASNPAIVTPGSFMVFQKLK